MALRYEGYDLRKEVLEALLLFVIPVIVAFPLYALAIIQDLQMVYYAIYTIYIIGSLALTRYNRRAWTEIGLTRTGIAESLVSAIGFVLAFMLIQVIQSGYHLATNLVSLVIIEQIIFNFVFSGVGQELLFRGLILFSLWRWKNWQIAIGLSSVLFGIIHITKGINYVLATILIGAFYGYITYRTKNIIGPMIAHGLNNFVLGFLFVL